ncbi:14506_t:CDS:2, partial [Ambispora leptoticha]
SKDYGNCERSGKMLVVKSLLEMWKPKGHRVLLFSQSTEMLDILEKFVKSLRYKYRRLDGTTPISKRPFLVEEFNNDESIYVLLLTTKVGGVGLNLTGADRIIIYDPDWNPSNDDQATERAARPGQSKNVSIYRLMTFGTIEEKIYHRQLFKRMMSNKITRKPSKDDIQFEAEDLYDLFSLGDPDAKDTETSYISTSRNKSNPNGNSLLAHIHTYNKLSTFNNPKTAELLDSEEEGEIRERPSNGDAFDGVVMVEDRNKDQKEEKEESEEKDLLQMLYKTAGLHSVFKHDKVLGAKSTNNSSVFERVIDEKARKAAKEAKEALEISRHQLRNLPLGTLTWTGQSDAFDEERLAEKEIFEFSHSAGEGLEDQSPEEVFASVKAKEVEVRNLLQRGNASNALIIAIDNPPYGLDRDNAKELNVKIVMEVLNSIKTTDIPSVVKMLSSDQQDTLMKYIYRGMETPKSYPSAILLNWHEKLTEIAGVGCIVRVITDRKTL